MKTILKHIFEKKRAYGCLPLFERMRDEGIDVGDRVAFYPCMAYFILSFGDLNRYVLRYDTVDTPFHSMVNTHTFEDDHHWPWYLEDLAKLGFDVEAHGSEWMRFLWGEETKHSRLLTYRLVALIEGASCLERLVIIEAIEETGNVFFTEMGKLARVLSARIGAELRYCGDFHLRRESGHAVGLDHRELAGIPLDTAARERCLRLVDQVFDLFGAWAHELYRYAQARAAPGRATRPRVMLPLTC